MKSLFIILFILGFSVLESQVPPDHKLLYTQNFSDPQAFKSLDMTDPDAWKIKDSLGNKSLELYKASEYKPLVRSPFNIALVRDLQFSDFVLEVDLAQTGREYGHRDLCLIFGFQNPSNFYYVHIASKTDDHANNIFIVNDEPRKKISTTTNAGNDWGETGSWHKARIERNVKSGSIKIYFDDMTKPIMEANDTHFKMGMIGFGSFDDTGRFDNVKVWGSEMEVKSKSVFK